MAEIDTHIKYACLALSGFFFEYSLRNLDKQVESGNLKIAEEKRALLEISQCKRSRKTVESFKADQDAIEADRLTVENLRKQLDDPTTKAMSDRFDAIKAELDELKRQGDEAYAGRNKLFEEKDTLQNEVNKLYEEKRDSAKKYREAGDKYWAKVSEDRARRAEKLRAQRAEEENAKKLELAERLREEASVRICASELLRYCPSLKWQFRSQPTNSRLKIVRLSLITSLERRIRLRSSTQPPAPPRKQISLESLR